MKQLKWILTLMVTMVISITLSSCSKDDDEPGGGKKGITATLDGKSLGFTNVYYYTLYNTMYIEFYTYDITNPKFSSSTKLNFLSIDYDIPRSQTEIETITLDGGDYHLYVAEGVTMSDEGWQGETDYRGSNDSPLEIVRDGNKITINIKSAQVEDESDDRRELKLSFSGNIPLMPDEYIDY